MSKITIAKDFLIDYFNQEKGLVITAHEAKVQREEKAKAQLAEDEKHCETMMEQCREFFMEMMEREFGALKALDPGAYFVVTGDKDLRMALPSIKRELIVGSPKDIDGVNLKLYVMSGGNIEDAISLMSPGGRMNQHSLYNTLAKQFELVLDRFIKIHKLG